MELKQWLSLDPVTLEDGTELGKTILMPKVRAVAVGFVSVTTVFSVRATGQPVWKANQSGDGDGAVSKSSESDPAQAVESSFV